MARMQCCLDHGHDESSLDPMPHGIANEQNRFAPRQLNDIQDIAPNLGCRFVAEGNLQAGHFNVPLRNQRLLDLPGHCQFSGHGQVLLLNRCFLLGKFAVEPTFLYHG